MNNEISTDITGGPATRETNEKKGKTRSGKAQEDQGRLRRLWYPWRASGGKIRLRLSVLVGRPLSSSSITYRGTLNIPIVCMCVFLCLCVFFCVCACVFMCMCVCVCPLLQESATANLPFICLHISFQLLFFIPPHSTSFNLILPHSTSLFLIILHSEVFSLTSIINC